ncbi:SDR family NAD(P)-dependent oxidoreductase [Aquiflexum sp.]|uniref:SDR family NAD(P)-dependent oxidoreductase n=1 Tax=Aquiflexum sp. TaxID=1872584 RepID=UPI00359436C8
MKKLENKVAIVTGGAGSIGRNTAKLFLDEGAKVLLVDLEEEVLKKAVEELGGKDVKYCVADVSKSEDVQRYADKAVEYFGKIDVFFNNPGIEGVEEPIVDYSEEIFDKVNSVNVRGVWLRNKYLLPQMNVGGSIISLSGLVGGPYISAYIAGEHICVGILQVMSVEADLKKIKVNSIYSSPFVNRIIRSPDEGFSRGQGAEIKVNLELAIPLWQYVQASEIAELVMIFASDDTIQVFDGGMTVH